MAIELRETAASGAGLHAAVVEAYGRRWKSLTLQVLAGLTIVGLTAYSSGLLDAATLGTGIPAMAQLFAESVPPDFARWQSWIKPLLDTLTMSIAGTSLAVLFSVPLALLAARNTSPHPAVFHGARTILNGLRAIPELILGIVFVAAVGFGVLPGVLALGLHSIGMVGKFFAESIEHVDNAPVEAARAAGAGSVQVMVHGILRQVLPQFADVAIYRWEYNFRASTVMGMVGAGGIGFELMSSLRIMDYQQVMAILLVILVMVTTVDSLSGSLRKRFK